jgi:hypothetical protein
MRFIDRFGTMAKGRRAVSSSDRVSREDVQDADRLATVLNRAFARITTVESTAPNQSIEFELKMAAATDYPLEHGFNAPIRWYVTRLGLNGATAPATIYEASTPTLTRLVVRSTVACYCVIRVEASPHGVSF